MHGRVHAHAPPRADPRAPYRALRQISGQRQAADRIDSGSVAANTDKNSTGARLRATLAAVAPGTELREGLERILRGRTGALIVLGHDKAVDAISTGGFEIDIEFTATGLRELSKMDGAIVLDRDATRLIQAAVHLMPDPSIVTQETGTRHRTADRVARQTGFPVISVSQSMHIIALYVDDQRYVLEDSGAILSRANQALATLERYKLRLDEVSGTLSALEIEDLVTVRDVAAVAQRLEMVRRIATEIDGYVVELGTDGRLLTLQLNELVAGVAGERELVVRDYLPPATGRRPKTADDVLLELDAVSPTDLLDIGQVARALQLGGAEQLDAAVTPRGYRLLAKVPRLPGAVIDRLIDHFGHLQKLLAASIDDLQTVEGVGENRARTVREGLSRLAESSILERYV
ncbi:diadenylate cyclase [Kribbella sp. VKM Ac-2569]|nr:diadenylate cyclase [Kribbella sp. VKM Ac-2569]